MCRSFDAPSFAGLQSLPNRPSTDPTDPVSREAARPISISALLVEDDVAVATSTREFLEHHSVATTWVPNGGDALREVGRRTFDVIVLDLTLPGRDGLEVCWDIRQRSDVPIIIVSGRTGEEARLDGFEAGADDYVTKPFSPRELVSRITAVVRRSRGLVGPDRRTLVAGKLILDPNALIATQDGRDLALTGYEFNLLYALAARRGRIVSRDQLLEAAGSTADATIDRSIDVHVSRVRQKLGDDARQPKFLKTVRGAGYMLVALDDE